MRESVATVNVVHQMMSQDKRTLFVVLPKKGRHLLRVQIVERILVSQKGNHCFCGPFVSSKWDTEIQCANENHIVHSRYFLLKYPGLALLLGSLETVVEPSLWLSVIQKDFYLCL